MYFATGERLESLMVLTLEATDEAAYEKGRRLVAGDLADDGSMASSFALIAYLEANREQVRRRGCCGNQADAETWIRPGDGATCCKHTREPCPRTALAELIELWKIPNQARKD